MADRWLSQNAITLVAHLGALLVTGAIGYANIQNLKEDLAATKADWAKTQAETRAAIEKLSERLDRSETRSADGLGRVTERIHGIENTLTNLVSMQADTKEALRDLRVLLKEEMERPARPR